MTGRGIACILLDGLLLVLALGTGIRELLVAALSLGVFWVYGLLSLLLASVSVRTRGKLSRDEVTRGDTVEYSFFLQGLVLLPVAGHLTVLPPGVERSAVQLRQRHAFFLPFTLLRHRREFCFTLACPHRGCWQTGLETLRLQDIFGLFSLPLLRGRSSALCPLTVSPRVYALEQEEEASVSQGFAMAQMNSAASGDLFGDTRIYQPGDAMKRIHWKQTVRTRQIYVRQYEAQENPQTLLLLDLGCRGQDVASLADISTEVIATLASYAVQQGRVAQVLLLRGQSEADLDGVCWIHNEAELMQLLRRLPELSFYPETEPLDPWQLRDGSFSSCGAVRVVTDNPSRALLDTLEQMSEQGHRVSCFMPVPQPMEDSTLLVGGGACGVLLTRPEEIPEKVGECL